MRHGVVPFSFVAFGFLLHAQILRGPRSTFHPGVPGGMTTPHPIPTLDDTARPSPPPRTFHLTLAYDGTRYAGWQVQPRVPTIQGELERVVERIAGEPIRILASGRTDAGVHAVGQVARVVLPSWRPDASALQRAINSKLPPDIAVRAVRETRPEFHPIGDAVAKTYRFHLQVGGDRDVFTHRFVQRVRYPLDENLLQAAAAKFVGCHDFAAFETSGAPRVSTVRTLTVSRWLAPSSSVVEPAAGDPAGDGSSRLAVAPQPLGSLLQPAGGRILTYEVQGEGFLYNMVRNLVGAMLEVGRGKRPVHWIDQVIESRDRRRGGQTAAASGLFLVRVEYPESVFLEQD